MIVMKFGGTSTQDADAIRNVVGIVERHISEKPIIVISAIAQATNVLERAGRIASEGRAGEARDLVLTLINRHFAIVDEIVQDRERNRDLRKVIANSLGELEELVKGVAILRELTPRTLDTFYCYGELLSSRIVAAALQERGIEAQWLDTADFMVTDDNFTRALPVMHLVEERLGALARPLLERGITPVTQGFIGISPSGRRTTMGRESSDYSAAIIGAALGSSDIQIWTDVDGVLTADPRIVDAPRKIRTLSFEEAYELSYFGAKVLHPNTMLPAIEKNIPIRIFNSRRPGSPGTLVTRGAVSTQTIVKSVAYRRDVVILTFVPAVRYRSFPLWEHIHTVLTKYDAHPDLSVTSESSYAMSLEASLPVGHIARELESIGSVSTLGGKGIVCVVGSNIRQAPGVTERVFRSIADLGPTMISCGASSSSLCIVLEDDAIPGAVRNIHREFFETSKNAELFEELEHRSAGG